MKIITRGKNIPVTEGLKQHVEKRIGKLEKYFDENTEAQVTLSVTKDSHIVEVTVLLNGGLLLRAEEESQDMYASIDMVIEKLERQTRKYKTRVNRKARQESIKDIIGDSAVKVEEDIDEPKVVRVKKFNMKPMVVEEAILQMDLLGHDFFVFVNGETDDINVVYRRKNGDYGLIEPQY
ncbi:SSU ribosomal protein S30P /sigma 54 modulation protein [Anaerobranca californiensis DSM 14826]|jgi:putative sigma-54 modulation protein|uniref:Ribosome hibernation promoting factor n=1 Tax=Anaerobranca californiensis DSM 14826 TaxID=1120989 RepID=A0A1M6PCE0_9FIRM|nr:ribosome-associated translation inhibitor RaiA [Anaerobranca californiensis]SHK05587.1 SSU ribosomal protein S30P /sigma 54 modulation protein [Anaerobranca californiensis DSM 14826]